MEKVREGGREEEEEEEEAAHLWYRLVAVACGLRSPYSSFLSLHSLPLTPPFTGGSSG